MVTLDLAFFFLHNYTLLNLNKEQGAHIIDFLIYSFLLCPHPFLASSQRRTNARKRVRRSTSLLFLYGGCKSAHLHEGGGGGHKHHILTMPVNEMQQVAEVLCELRKFIKYNSEGAAQKKKNQKNNGSIYRHRDSQTYLMCGCVCSPGPAAQTR